MSASHHHHHEHVAASGQQSLLRSIVLNLIITIAEAIGGIVSGSLSLLADALHNFNDTASLGISYVARKISRKEADQKRTFGYERAEIIGAFINLITLVLIALYLIVEAVERFINPQDIDGRIMLVVGSIALLANLATILLLYRHSEGSLNIKSAFVHIVSDALASVAVLVGAALIILYQVYIVDPILTAIISVYILIQSYHMLKQTIDILMESAPSDLDLDELIHSIHRIDGVQDMHHVHLWRLDESRLALEAHISVCESDLDKMETIKQNVKTRLSDDFDIAHSTLEFETSPCENPCNGSCYQSHSVQIEHE